MKRIVAESPEEHFLLWHDLENERHAIKKALPEVVDIYGSMDYDLREKRVIEFSEGRTKLFATKNHCPVLVVIFRDIATGRYSLELIMNSMILSRQYIDAIVFCRKNQW